MYLKKKTKCKYRQNEIVVFVLSFPYYYFYNKIFIYLSQTMRGINRTKYYNSTSNTNGIFI